MFKNLLPTDTSPLSYKEIENGQQKKFLNLHFCEKCPKKACLGQKKRNVRLTGELKGIIALKKTKSEMLEKS